MSGEGTAGGERERVKRNFLLGREFQSRSLFVHAPHRPRQVFLNKVSSHPVLREAPELATFLTSPDADWILEMARWQVGMGKGMQAFCLSTHQIVLTIAREAPRWQLCVLDKSSLRGGLAPGSWLLPRVPLAPGAQALLSRITTQQVHG